MSVLSGRTPAGIPFPIGGLDIWTPEEAFREMAEAIPLSLHPVGSYFWSDDPTNPAEFFGGTWQRVTGRVLVAADENDPDFRPGQVGGVKTVTLTAAQSGLPAHSHSMAHTHSINHDHAAVTSSSAGAHTHTSAAHSHSMAHTHSINHDHAAVTSSSAGAHTHATGDNVRHWGSGDVHFRVGDAGGGLIVAVSGGASGNFLAGNTTGANTSSNGAHTHSVDLPNFTGTSGASSAANTGSTTPGATGSAGAHTHSVDLPNFTGTSGASSAANTGSTTAANATAAHTNLMPFLAAYCWRRTA